MKHFRKIMAFVTALALLISILPAGALATVGSTTTSDYTVVTTFEELAGGIEEGIGEFQLQADIILEETEMEWIEIPEGASIVIDLNGHTLSLFEIWAGAEVKMTSFSVFSSGKKAGIFNIQYLGIGGNLDFKNCTVTVSGNLNGSLGKLTLDGASVTIPSQSADIQTGDMEGVSLGWFGSAISLSNQSTINLNQNPFILDKNTKVVLESGSKISGIPSIYVSGNDEKPYSEEYIATIEEYAAAAGFTLSVDKEGDDIVFLDESGKQVESGSLKGVTKLESADVEISINDKLYNGRVKDIEVKVDGKALDRGVDYDASFQNAAGNMVSECKDAGKYTVSVTGKGDYSGTATGQIEIAKADALYEPPKKPIDGTQSLSEQYEDLGLPYCNTSIEIISNSTSLSTSVGKNSQITLAGSWKFENVANITMDSGKYDAGAVFTPDDKNYNEVKTTVVISTWGAEVNVGTETSPAWNYEARSGVTSAPITDGITWLKEESGGVTTWYGIDNSKKVFAEGSKFSVQKLSEKENKEEWNKYLAKLDEAQKKLIIDNKLDIFLVGVDDPDGKAYTSLSGPTEFYIQLGDGWDKEKLQALFISDAEDETYTIEIVEMVLPDETKAKMAKMTLKHLSPYALMAISLPDPSPETGDTSRILLWILLAAFSCGAMTFAAVYNRKRRQA